MKENDPEIKWRVEAMQTQLSAKGPVPLLIARNDMQIPVTRDKCFSCGEFTGNTLATPALCEPCAIAKEIVLGLYEKEVNNDPIKDVESEYEGSWFNKG